MNDPLGVTPTVSTPHLVPRQGRVTVVGHVEVLAHPTLLVVSGPLQEVLVPSSQTKKPSCGSLGSVVRLALVGKPASCGSLGSESEACSPCGHS